MPRDFEHDDDDSMYHRGEVPSAQGSAPSRMLLLKELTVTELIRLKGEIESLLPARNLSDLNLEEATVQQFLIAQELQQTVLAGEEEANKKAQVINTCASTLAALVKMQTELHTAERLKEIEGRLIRCLEAVPSEYLKEFFNWYEGEKVNVIT